MDVPKVDIDSILDKIKRAQAGETVPGVTVYDGAAVVEALTGSRTENKAGSSGLIMALVAIGVIAVLPKRKSK